MSLPAKRCSIGYRATATWSQLQSDGDECLRFLDENPAPAAIVTDLLMPGTSGWDLVKALRSELRFASTPIMVMTASEPDRGYPVKR
jgi:CheY-like chemotaxis protein